MHKEVQHSPKNQTEMEILISTIFLINAVPRYALQTNNPHSTLMPYLFIVISSGNCKPQTVKSSPQGKQQWEEISPDNERKDGRSQETKS